MVLFRKLAPELKALLCIVALLILSLVGYGAYLLYDELNSILANFVTNDNSIGLVTMVVSALALLILAVFFFLCVMFTSNKKESLLLAYDLSFFLSIALMVVFLILIGKQNSFAHTAQWQTLTSIAPTAACIVALMGVAGLAIIYKKASLYRE